MHDDKRQRALEWLYLEQKITKIRIGHTERKRGAKHEELAALGARLENIETCIEYVRTAEDERKETLFRNDMFSIVWQAFKELFPDQSKREFVINWVDAIEDDDNNEAYGVTNFGEDGKIRIYISGCLPVVHATEVFAHELAHVAAGADAEHGAAWEAAFDAIHTEYMKRVKKTEV